MFLPTNIGREPLLSYLVALAIAIFGIGDHAIYIASAFAALPTVPAVYLFVRALFADEKPALRDGAGLLAAATLAASYWHVNWSRYGGGAIMVPLCAPLTLGVLAHAPRKGSRVGYVLTGILLGLSIYTYQSARLLPLLVVIAFALDA